MTAAIETHGLHKRYGRRTALQALDLVVEPGTVFGLIGPNGAGKTTTLRILLDIIRPSGGEVRVLGEDPRAGGPALRKRIGYVPGELRLDSRTTGRGLLDFFARVSGPSAKGRAEELADRLGLDLSRRVRTLSKGNKQKLGLVQAFLHEPELLILDEPTSGLDPLVQRTFIELVREARGRGQTVLLSSHVLSEIQQTADEVAVLSEGRVVAEGDVSSLRLNAVRRIRAGVADATADEVATALRALRLHDLDVANGPDHVRVAATAEGGIDAVVKTLAGFRVVDLTVEEPDLEESVLRLYGAERHGSDRQGSDRQGVEGSGVGAAASASLVPADAASADAEDDDASTPRSFRSNFVAPSVPQADAETQSVVTKDEAAPSAESPPAESPSAGTRPVSTHEHDAGADEAEEHDDDEVEAHDDADVDAPPEWPPDPDELLAAPVVAGTRPASARGTFTPVTPAPPTRGPAVDLETAEARPSEETADADEAPSDGPATTEPPASAPAPSEPPASEPEPGSPASEPARPLLRRDLRRQPQTGILPVADRVQHDPGAGR